MAKDKDLRLAVDYLDNPKIKRVLAAMGDAGIRYHIGLLCYARKHYPKGVLKDMTAMDIGIAAGCPALQAEEFVRILIENKLLEARKNNFKIHDWKEHNPYAFYEKERSDLARKAAEAKWRAGKGKKATRSQRLSKAKKIGDHTRAEWDEMRNYFGICVKCEGRSGLKNIERDHIIPIYQGGSNGIENIQPMCAKCNAAKGAESIDYRINFCLQRGLDMPFKWLTNKENEVTRRGLQDVCRTPAERPSPPPSPYPSPPPIPLPYPIPNITADRELLIAVRGLFEKHFKRELDLDDFNKLINGNGEYGGFGGIGKFQFAINAILAKYKNDVSKIKDPVGLLIDFLKKPSGDYLSDKQVDEYKRMR